LRKKQYCTERRQSYVRDADCFQFHAIHKDKNVQVALRNIVKDWQMPLITWRAAKAQFAILFRRVLHCASVVRF